MNLLPPLTLLTLTPLLGGLLLLALGSRLTPRQAITVGLVVNGLALFLVSDLWFNFDPGFGGIQLEERHRWIPSLGVEYHLGVDGLGLLMVILSALIIPFALLVARESPTSNATFVALMLFLQAGLFGSFTALNFFHWFLFWELSLVPAYFLIKLWGGPRRVEAATQFFLYTLVGSVTMLLGFLAIGGATGLFDFIRLGHWGRHGDVALMLSAKLGWPDLATETIGRLIFLGVLLGFAVKVPLVPFHTWLPAAYAEAPTSVTMVLTGVMSKMGVYGFLRILLPIFPREMRWALPVLLALAVATIVLSALAALAQRDLKRMLAYSSINHLGYCLLGIFASLQVTGSEPIWDSERAAALNGVLLQMFNHGLTAAALFCFVAFLEQRSGGLRDLDDFGGLRRAAPVFCGLMGLAVFASLGLPGLNGFVGEFLIFKGAFALAPGATAGAAFGLLVTAVFLLTLLQRVFHGPLPARWAGFADLTWNERLIVLPAVALMFWLGLWPQAVLGWINPTVLQFVRPLAP
jgi:NADH-quinone oxidoreductase subunit M